MDLKINEPEIEMGGGQVIRSGNENRPMSMINVPFTSEADAIAAHRSFLSVLISRRQRR
jgi:hypothetical protein